MTEETRNDDDTEATEDTGPRGGERLRAAREEQQISLLEIAKELHLDEHKVRALEANDFATLGAPVFAKGHLRKYSELVGVDERDVLSDYYELTRSDGMPPVVGERRRPGNELSPGPWIVMVLVVLALVFAFWWFTSGRAGSDVAGTPPAATPAPAEEEPAASEAVLEGVSVDAADVAGAVADPEPADVVETDVAPVETVSAAPVGPESIRVTLSFGEDCWTEITDASGQRLYFELGRAGTTVDVDGTPPLSVLLGSADNVDISVNGEAYAIGPGDRRGRTARLTLP